MQNSFLVVEITSHKLIRLQIGHVTALRLKQLPNNHWKQWFIYEYHVSSAVADDDLSSCFNLWSFPAQTFH